MTDRLSPSADLDYDTAKRMAASQDAGERQIVASRAETQPEILYFLAGDRSPEVRREIAKNASTPRQADLMLSTDPDERVRSGLAGKIAALAPALSPSRIGQIERMTLDILETLARDQAVAVRQVVAETLRDCGAAATSQIVQQLSRDLELSVSGPVLTHSPLLTDEDLLSIIRGQPLDGHLVAIAERAGVSAGVSDALVRTEREAAVAALLSNRSAQIREETLDRIIDMAPRHEPWHGPLVRRPQLPARAAARIAGFVNQQLLRVLENRTDLPAETRAAIAKAVETREAPNRLPAGGIETIEDAAAAPPAVGDRPVERAEKLYKKGKLDEEAVSAAMTQGDRVFVMAALGLRANIPFGTVEKIITGQSPRGVTALCWRAGLSMRFARQVQLRLAQIPPTAVMNARDGTEYPMSESELKWQLEFFGIKT